MARQWVMLTSPEVVAGLDWAEEMAQLVQAWGPEFNPQNPVLKSQM